MVKERFCSQLKYMTVNPKVCNEWKDHTIARHGIHLDGQADEFPENLWNCLILY